MGETYNTPYLNAKDGLRPLNPNENLKIGTCRKTTELFAFGIWKRKDSWTTIPLQTGTARWTLGTRDKAPCFPGEASWRVPEDREGRDQLRAHSRNLTHARISALPPETGLSGLWEEPAWPCVSVTSARKRSVGPALVFHSLKR